MKFKILLFSLILLMTAIPESEAQVPDFLKRAKKLRLVDAEKAKTTDTILINTRVYVGEDDKWKAKRLDIDTLLKITRKTGMIGEVKQFAGDNIPVGWMEANGSVLATNDYPELFNAIGNKFGGDGINSFAIPLIQNHQYVNNSQIQSFWQDSISNYTDTVRINYADTTGYTILSIDGFTCVNRETYRLSGLTGTIAGLDEISWVCNDSAFTTQTDIVTQNGVSTSLVTEQTFSIDIFRPTVLKTGVIRHIICIK